MSTTRTPAAAPGAPARADARRNRERLIAAATETVAAHGPDASLNEIAHRAGVGPGTLYRHFPDRQALLLAVFRDRVDALCARAAQLATRQPPGTALVSWLHEVLAHARAHRGLASSLMITDCGSAEVGFDCREMMHAATHDLLTRAQQSAHIRSDVTAGELFRLVSGIALTADANTTDPVRDDRLLALTLEGLTDTPARQ